LILLAACAAPMQSIQIVNHTARPIEELYVYPQGAKDRGASRGALQPNGETKLQVKQGFVEVYAVSAKYQLDEHTRDRPSASQDVEVRTTPVQIIFYDAGHMPPGLDRPGVFGVAFTTAH
jgi:hypothetical protein